MKNDYSYSITEIRNVVRDIRENQEWFDDSYYVEKLVNIMEREKEFVVQMIRNKEEHKKILKENPKLLRTKSVFSHAFESLNDEFEKGVIKGRLEAIPITRELVKEAEERGFQEGYKRAYEASLFGKKEIRNT